jgi:cytochrome P450
MAFVWLAVASALLLLGRSIYRIYFHPLSHITGPLLPKLTSLWLHYHAYVGNEASSIHLLHLKYGPFVRVSPNEVDISDADAVHPIYISRGGFPKAPCYGNFDIDGHKTIFSTTSHEHRAPRAKAVALLFSTKSIRENADAIDGCIDRFVKRLKEEAESNRPVNVLNLTRSLAVDVVSTHLFSENYNGTSEKGSTLSASAFVDAFVAVGRLFYLPNMAFVWLEWAATKYFSNERTHESMSLVDRFVDGLVEKTTRESTTYPGYMLAAGLDSSEVKAQCKDLLFAGTDSTGMNLAIILRNLVLHPEK